MLCGTRVCTLILSFFLSFKETIQEKERERIVAYIFACLLVVLVASLRLGEIHTTTTTHDTVPAWTEMMPFSVFYFDRGYGDSPPFIFH